MARSCVTDSTGVCYMEWTNRTTSQNWVDVTINSVSGGATWTGATNYIRLYKP